MRNILRYLFLALVVIGFTAPVFGKAEAAKIAILPLANNVADDELSGQVFFNECMDYFKFPEFDMIDDTVLDKALKEENYAVVGKNGPDEAMLKRIMAKTGADMALMMSLDELSQVGLSYQEDITISSMCTVFAESEVVSLVAQNKEVSDIIHGLNVSVASKVGALAARLGKNNPGEYMMTGGVAKNQGIIQALEEKLGAKLYICDEAQLCGALGAAIFAYEKCKVQKI